MQFFDFLKFGFYQKLDKNDNQIQLHRTKIVDKNYIYDETNKQPWICPEINCGKRYKHRYSLKAHYKIHTPDCFICKICHKRYPAQMKLEEHFRVHTKLKPYKCFCGKAFTQNHKLSFKNEIIK